MPRVVTLDEVVRVADRVKATDVAAADVCTGGAECTPSGPGGPNEPWGAEGPAECRSAEGHRGDQGGDDGGHGDPAGSAGCRCGRWDRGRSGLQGGQPPAAGPAWPRPPVDRGQVLVPAGPSGPCPWPLRLRPGRPPGGGPVATKTPSWYSTDSLICAPSSYPVLGDGHALTHVAPASTVRLPGGNRSDRSVRNYRRASLPEGFS